MPQRVAAISYELLGLSDANIDQVVNGDLEGLHNSGAISDELYELAKQARTIVNSALASVSDPRERAKLAGKLTGIVIVELAKTALGLGAGVAASAAAKSQQAQKLAKYLSKVGGGGVDEKSLIKKIEKAADEARDALPDTPSSQQARLLHILDDPTCFTAGTPVRTADGWKPIEQIRQGDRVLSRPEGDPEAIRRLPSARRSWISCSSSMPLRSM